MPLDLILALAALLLALGATIFAASSIRAYRRKTNQYLEYLPRHIWNSISLQNLIDSPIPLPSPTGWAADSDLLAELSRLVALSKPMIIVELGSGLSTAVIAATLRNNGLGRVISIDHDADYARNTQQAIELAHLQSHAEIVVAPLGKQPRAHGDTSWYALENVPLPANIDLVFVDGPPAPLDRNIREPALDYFWPLLAAGGSIVFDDTDRLAEQTFINKWLSRHPDAITRRPATLKGCTIITKPAS